MTNTSLSRASAERPVDRLPTGAPRWTAFEFERSRLFLLSIMPDKRQNTPAPNHVCFRKEQETAYPRAIPLKSQTDLQRKYPMAINSPVFRLVLQ
jgi:hypothetical protein